MYGGTDSRMAGSSDCYLRTVQIQNLNKLKAKFEVAAKVSNGATATGQEPTVAYAVSKKRKIYETIFGFCS